jgi:hypothetical protein
MKKSVLIGLCIFLALFVGVVLIVKSRKASPSDSIIEEEDDTTVAELPLTQRPFTSLTPRGDGHWLDLSVKNLSVVTGAQSMDYELVYTVKDGRTQGVPGTIKLTGENNITRELLLGSESSGKFRYDEGVSQGTFTLRFRNSNGKLLGKLTTQFMLYSTDSVLSSSDKSFTFTLDKKPRGYFLVMDTFGLPSSGSETFSSGPYGVFASDGTQTGKVGDGSYKRYSDSGWSEVSSSASVQPGVFIKL